MKAILTVLVLAALFWPVPLFSADKPAKKAPDYAEMRKEAPEHLVLEITSARRQRLNTKHGFYFSWNVRGKIVEVKRSEANLSEGTVIAFRYRVPDRSVNDAEGDYPRAVEMGNTYEVYLQPGPDGRKLYVPAAGAASFVVKESKAAGDAAAAKKAEEAAKNVPAVRKWRD